MCLTYYRRYIKETMDTAEVHTLLLKGVDVGFLLSYVPVVGDTGVSGRKHQTQTGNHYPATCGRRGSNPGRSGNKRGFYPCAFQGLQLRDISISVRIKYI